MLDVSMLKAAHVVKRRRMQELYDCSSVTNTNAPTLLAQHVAYLVRATGCLALQLPPCHIASHLPRQSDSSYSGASFLPEGAQASLSSLAHPDSGQGWHRAFRCTRWT